ncbi:MAG: hypothetical protein K9N62_13365 [Verrucomicrobia bacterium]|nr:hypothetical protein [Verrucomicrobiota bacterium]
MKNTITPNIMVRMEGRFAALAFILALGVCLAPRVANANWAPTQYFPFSSFADNFDGSIEDDTPVTWKNSWRISMTAQGGDLVLSDPLPLGPELALGLNEVWKDGRRIMVKDTSIQAVIKLDNPNSFVGIYSRAQDGSGDGGAYVGNMFPDGEISVSRFGGERHSVKTPLDPVNGEVVLQFDTIGNRITLTAWDAQQPASVYSTTWTDLEGPRPMGFLGLGVGGGGPDALEGKVIVSHFKVERVQPFFVEDFADGDASDGNPVKWAPPGEFASGTTGRVVDGSYVLTATEPSSVWVEQPSSIGDVSIRAVVRGVSITSVANVIVLFARAQPEELGGASYWGSASPMGLQIAMTAADGTRTVMGHHIDWEFTLKPFKNDINMQLDVVDRKISLTAWVVGSKKPSPQLIGMAPAALPPGRVGFYTDAPEVAIRSFDAIRIANSVQPTMDWENSGGKTLRFTVPSGYVLQSRPTFESLEWSDVEGTGLIEIPTSDSAGFFQLRRR